jgi:hypothetical protein
LKIAISVLGYILEGGFVVKNLATAITAFILVLGSASSAASALKADAAAVKIAAVSSELSAVEKAAFQAGWITGLEDTNVFWVLGGGLVAAGLVARRAAPVTD